MRTRGVAFLLLMVLLSAACGARLTDEQREIALQAYQGGGGGGGGDGDGGTDPGDPSDPTSPGATVGPGTGGGGGGGGGGGDGGGGGGAAACEGDGSAPDTGVTADQINIAVVVDESGVQTGLFTPARQAMQAWAAYVNQAGGICGRQVVIHRYDTGTSGGGNLRGTRQACNADFAIVGSMSAFDGGGYDAGNDCGIPAIPAISTNAWKEDEFYPPNYFPAYPNRADYVIDTATYVMESHPELKDGVAAAIWLNQPVARLNMGGRIKAYEQAGFNFEYRQEAQVTDPNYSSYVSQMKNHDPPVKYLTFVGNYQSAENLLVAMDQQSWHPDFIDFDSVVYSPLFLKDLKDRGITTTNLFWFINSAMFEESSGNEEMQLYMEWLQRVGGGAPDFFGLYAWSAGRLFEQVATQVGPKLTRKAFLAEIAKVKEWDGHGLHGAHRVGEKLNGPCYLYGDIQNYEFHRISPASGWTCNRPTRQVPYPADPNRA